jgi:hypothetical protein
VSVESIPHSFLLKNWPPHVAPGSVSKARRMVREYRTELTAAGALARVGRELVIIGARFEKWLQKRGAEVPGYECPANRARSDA